MLKTPLPLDKSQIQDIAKLPVDPEKRDIEILPDKFTFTYYDLQTIQQSYIIPVRDKERYMSAIENGKKFITIGDDLININQIVTIKKRKLITSCVDYIQDGRVARQVVNEEKYKKMINWINGGASEQEKTK